MTVSEYLDRTLARWRRMSHDEDLRSWAATLTRSQRKFLRSLWKGLEAGSPPLSMASIKAAVDAVGAEERERNGVLRQLRELSRFRVVGPDKSPGDST